MFEHCPFCGYYHISKSQEDDRIIYICSHCDASWYRIIKEK